MRVAYLCDRDISDGFCDGYGCAVRRCKHTTNVGHAKNGPGCPVDEPERFRRHSSDLYYEREAPAPSPHLAG